jgi:hypothetical protein
MPARLVRTPYEALRPHVSAAVCGLKRTVLAYLAGETLKKRDLEVLAYLP